MASLALGPSAVPAYGKTDQRTVSTQSEKKSPRAQTVGQDSKEKVPRQTETYRDLIQKAQNLSLQQDRLQASRLLLRGLARENRVSPAFKEMARALDELTTLFYTERAQSIFSTGEAAMSSGENKREAMDSFIEALKIEDQNVTILKSIIRLNLILESCDRAEPYLKQAEEMNPYSPEVRLLRIQYLACLKDAEGIAAQLTQVDSEMSPVELFLYGYRVEQALRQKDLKRARLVVQEWEIKHPDYPEAFYWRWEISKASGSTDRLAAARYVQLCQGLSARKRKNYSLDVALCRSKEKAELYLQQSEAKASLSEAEGSVKGEERK